MRMSEIQQARASVGLQRALWWVLALAAAYAVASNPERLFAIGAR